MDSQEKSNTLCFYLGLLPQSASRSTLMPVLSTLGKVLRIRVAREQSDLACKGYGYAWIEPYMPPSEFTRQCLMLTRPILAYQIEGPKLLGSENTKNLRKFVRIDQINGQLSYQDIFEYLEYFGPLTLVVTELDSEPSQRVNRMQVLYQSELSVVDISSKTHVVRGVRLNLQTFVGLQESPFSEEKTTRAVVTYANFSDIEKMNQPLQTSQVPTQDFSDYGLKTTKAKEEQEHEKFQVISKHQVLKAQHLTSKTISQRQLMNAPVHRAADIPVIRNPVAICREKAEVPVISSALTESDLSLKCQGTLSRRILRRIGFVLIERHNVPNLRFNIGL